MGRYSDSEGSDHRSSTRKSKKKRRSRSRSRSHDSYSSKHKKKKSKRSKRSRSPRRRRSRSRSRSRSRDRRKRSRSDSRSRRSRSSSRSRRSRSRSRSYERRRRSRSRSRERRRSSSNSRSSPPRESSKTSSKVETDPSNIPGFELMTPIEKNEVRMQLALKAADMAAEKLKAAGMLDEEVSSFGHKEKMGLSAKEIEKRRKAIENIEADTFKQAQFKSSAKTQGKQKVSAKKELELSHDSAIFGDLLAGTGVEGGAVNKPKSVDITDPKALMGPVFFESEDVKMARWIDRLKVLRRHSHSNGSVS